MISRLWSMRHLRIVEPSVERDHPLTWAVNTRDHRRSRIIRRVKLDGEMLEWYRLRLSIDLLRLLVEKETRQSGLSLNS